MLKGWNINVEGRYLKLKKELMEKIDILDKNVKLWVFWMLKESKSSIWSGI
jgi:hypothetical protein